MDSNSQEIDILRELEKVNQDLQGKIRQDPKIMQSVTKPKVGFTDFRKLLDETNQSVRPIIEAFCESYVTNQNMLDPKVQQRLNIDSIALSEILWKKAVSDVAVIQIMERIDSGDDDYKMYAALSSILGTKNRRIKPIQKKTPTDTTEKRNECVKCSTIPKKNVPSTIPIFSVAS